MKYLLFLLVSFTQIFTLDKSDLVIFSFNRPLQLYALLESVEKYIFNLGEIHILYRSDVNFDNGYEEVKKRFNSYVFHKQSSNPHQDFKNLTLKYVFETSNDYILFAVDDIIVKDYLDVSKCIWAMQKTEAYCFCLRLGLNITECYMINQKIPHPKYQHLFENIYEFYFKDGIGGQWAPWSYPNNVDMTLYKKSDIKNIFEKIEFYNPTSLEVSWANIADLNKKGLFFSESKIVNIPLNVINKNSTNRNMKLYSLEQLNNIFNQNLKIDINQFYKINNRSPHAEYIPEFIKK